MLTVAIIISAVALVVSIAALTITIKNRKEG
ncbi:hypothetical protein HNR27_000578 [Ornithinibacillus bavariensis]